MRSLGHKRPASIVLADDHPLVREGLRKLLSGEPDLRIVAEAADGLEAARLCRKLRPDVALLDVRMPGLDGLSAAREIRATTPEVGVILVTMHENRDYLIEAARAGAAGYVLKDATPSTLLSVIRRVLNGEFLLDGEDPAAEARTARAPRPASPLSEHELDVLRLLDQGRREDEISYTLTLAPGVVEVHFASILAKLGAPDQARALDRARHLGLLGDGRQISARAGEVP